MLGGLVVEVGDVEVGGVDVEGRRGQPGKTAPEVEPGKRSDSVGIPGCVQRQPEMAQPSSGRWEAWEVGAREAAVSESTE